MLTKKIEYVNQKVMGKILGIDLGTTKSAIAYLERSTPEIILTPEGHRLLPSIVAFTPRGERLVGQPAKSQMITNPINTISSVKTLMGKKYSEVGPLPAGVPLPHHQTGRRLAAHRNQQPDLFAGGNFGHDPAQAQGSGRPLPERPHRRGDRYCSCLFQRLPAPGHQGRRYHRRPERHPHHQRTHRRIAGLFDRPEEKSPRSSSTISAAAPSTFPFWKCRTASSRCWPLPATPTWEATTSTFP